jgi:hypothetical protein
VETLASANRAHADRHDKNALTHGSSRSPTELVSCIPPIDVDQTAPHDVEHTRRMPRSEDIRQDLFRCPRGRGITVRSIPDDLI